MRHRAYWESRRPDCSRLSFFVDERSVGHAHPLPGQARQHNGPPVLGSGQFDGQAFPSMMDDNNGSTLCTGNKVLPSPFLDAKWRSHRGCPVLRAFAFAGLPIARRLPPIPTVAILAHTGVSTTPRARFKLPDPTLFAANSHKRPIHDVRRASAVSGQRMEGERFGHGK